MKASFLHLGDVHLGNEQYGRRERAEDFARAFYYAVEYAIQHRVDFVVVAGDLFERSTLDPVTFDQTLSGLKQLAMADIPLVAIAGNHDRARYGQGMAWLESLGRQGFLLYLDAVNPEGIILRRWSPEEGVGGFVDLKGVRFVGMHYLGASTARAIEELAEQLKKLQDRPSGGGTARPYTVALLHAGLDGVVPNFRAELTYEQLSPLQGLVDYVALGHIHQYYTREGWVYNPGSLETWNAGEVDWERGFLHVSVDSPSEQKHIAQLVQPPRRPFIRRHLDVEPCTSPLNLMELLRRSAAEWARAFHKSESDEPPDPGSAGSLPARPLGGGPPALPATGVAQPRPTGEPLTLLDARPVVHITLDGRLRFDRKDLDLGALEREIVEILQPLVVRIQDKTDETAFQVQTARGGDTLDRGALEFEILRQLFANDERRVHQATAWARLAQSLKQGALSKEDPARLVELVRRELQAITPTEKPPDPE